MAKGRLIPLTSLVWITSGMKLMGMALLIMLTHVPMRPLVGVESRSKLNTWDSRTVKKNYLIRADSGLMLR